MASVCSVWSLTWLYFGGRWGWSFSTSDTGYVAYLAKCNDRGLGTRGWPFSCLLDLFADRRESGDYALSTSFYQFCWDIVSSIWFSLSSVIVLQRQLLCEGWVGRPVSAWGLFLDLHWACDFTAESSILSIGSVSLVLLWGIFQNNLGHGSFSLFQSGQVFHELICPLTVVLPQIFFNHTTLFSYPVFLRLFHAPLDVVVHFLVFLRSFRF